MPDGIQSYILYKYTGIHFSWKPGTPLLQSTRSLHQVSERIRYTNYSLKTEKTYLYWVQFLSRFSATQQGGMRHPREVGVADVEAFLSMMANVFKASACTHNQALSALLFLSEKY